MAADTRLSTWLSQGVLPVAPQSPHAKRVQPGTTCKQVASYTASSLTRKKNDSVMSEVNTDRCLSLRLRGLIASMIFFYFEGFTAINQVAQPVDSQSSLA